MGFSGKSLVIHPLSVDLCNRAEWSAGTAVTGSGCRHCCGAGALWAVQEQLRKLLGYGYVRLREAASFGHPAGAWCLLACSITSRSCRSCCSPAAAHRHFDLFLITKKLLSRGKRASRVGGVQLAMRTSINLHQRKVEEGRHALHNRSLPGFQSTSICSCSVLHLDQLRPQQWF